MLRIYVNCNKHSFRREIVITLPFAISFKLQICWDNYLKSQVIFSMYFLYTLPAEKFQSDISFDLFAMENPLSLLLDAHKLYRYDKAVHNGIILRRVISRRHWVERYLMVWIKEVGLRGLGVTFSPRDPRFAGWNPAEVNGFFRT